MFTWIRTHGIWQIIGGMSTPINEKGQWLLLRNSCWSLPISRVAQLLARESIRCYAVTRLLGHSFNGGGSLVFALQDFRGSTSEPRTFIHEGD